MSVRDELHDLVDDLDTLFVDSAKPQAHANVDALEESDLVDELERLQTLRLLFEEQSETLQRTSTST